MENLISIRIKINLIRIEYFWLFNENYKINNSIRTKIKMIYKNIIYINIYNIEKILENIKKEDFKDSNIYEKKYDIKPFMFYMDRVINNQKENK